MKKQTAGVIVSLLFFYPVETAETVETVETVTETDAYSTDDYFNYAPYKVMELENGYHFISNEEDFYRSFEQLENINGIDEIKDGDGVVIRFGRFTYTIYEITPAEIDWINGQPEPLEEIINGIDGKPFIINNWV